MNALAALHERYVGALTALRERYVEALTVLRGRYLGASIALRERGHHCLSAIAEIRSIPGYKYSSTLPFKLSV